MSHFDARPQFDERDKELLDQRTFEWDKRSGPRVGDFVEMLDGTMRRLTHDWGDDIQTTMGDDAKFGSSFYFTRDGYMSFSGGLDRAIPKANLVDTGMEREGSVWFFHHNESRAHNGVYTVVTCRIYKQTTK